MASAATAATSVLASKRKANVVTRLEKTATPTGSTPRKDTPATLEIKPVYPATPFHSRRTSPEFEGDKALAAASTAKKMSKKWTFFVRKPSTTTEDNNVKEKENTETEESKAKVESWNMSNLLKSTLMTKDILGSKEGNNNNSNTDEDLKNVTQVDVIAQDAGDKGSSDSKIAPPPISRKKYLEQKFYLFIISRNFIRVHVNPVLDVHIVDLLDNLRVQSQILSSNIFLHS